MLKRLKLLTLVILTILLAVLSYPTWRDLVVPKPDAVPAWTDSDKLRLFVPSKTDTIVSVNLSASTFYQDPYTHTIESDRPTASLDFRIKPAHPSNDQPEGFPFFGYVEATGAADLLMQKCANGDHQHIGRVPEESVSDFRHLNEFGGGNLMVEGVDGRIEELPIPATPRFYYKLRGGEICDVTDNVWSTASNIKRFSMPQLSAGVGDSEYGDRSRPAVNGACADVSVNNLGTERANYRFPSSGPTDKTGAYDYVRWSTCNGVAPDRDNVQYQDAKLSATGVQFEDAAQNEKVARNLFFAGVFAAVLGALAIEIFNGTFDVAESWSARRRTRRDEQEQRPEPDPIPKPPPEPEEEPYYPGPRGYL